MNLHSQVSVSIAIIGAAQARKNSRGAHFRDDYPSKGDLDASTYTLARMEGDEVSVTEVPVEFTRVRPGQTLLDEETENINGVA